MKHLDRVLIALGIVIIGLVLFKFFPMVLYSEDILWDASAHISVTMLLMYVFWFFVDQSEELRIPYLLICAVILCIISFQRIMDNAHNDIGLLKGFFIGLIAILISSWDELKTKIKW